MAEYTGTRSLDDLHSFVTKYLEDHDELQILYRIKNFIFC